MKPEFIRQLGVALKSEELANEIAAIGNGMTGNIVLSFKTTDTKSAGSTAWTKTVIVEAKDSQGNLHTWLNQSFTTRLSIADTSTAGTASIASTTITFVDGVATIVISGSANAWVAAETATLTIANITLNGYTITGGTHVITIN
jgi:hypothetical protein